jgi:hypothetical protein
VSVSSKKSRALILLVALSTVALALPGLGSAAAAGKKPAPSIKVIGFGVNWLFAAKGSTIKSESQCDEIVGADTPVGPPQNVYLTVFVRATGIPKKAPTQIKNTMPYGYADAASPTFTDPFPFSQGFAAGAFPVGSPPNTKDLFREPLVSFDAATGPAAEEFDGEYSFTVSTKVSGRTLRSTGKVTVDCPYLR